MEKEGRGSRSLGKTQSDQLFLLSLASRSEELPRPLRPWKLRIAGFPRFQHSKSSIILKVFIQ